MIKSFKCRYSEKLYEGEFVKKFSGIERQAIKKLRILDCAENLNVLAAIPSNRLEKLLGDKKYIYSIRVNDQWRICFKWDDAPYEVEIMDYH